jgi:hypothetical protein
VADYFFSHLTPLTIFARLQASKPTRPPTTHPSSQRARTTRDGLQCSSNGSGAATSNGGRRNCLFGGWRASRKKCQSEYRVGAAIRERDWRLDPGKREERRRIHRHVADACCIIPTVNPKCDPAFRDVPRRPVAFARFTSETQNPTNEMGEHEIGEASRFASYPHEAIRRDGSPALKHRAIPPYRDGVIDRSA